MAEGMDDNQVGPRANALMNELDRREFVATSGAVAVALMAGSAMAATGKPWSAGEVVHILPTANHERILIKCSFRSNLADGVALRVNGKRFAGRRSDTEGRFWTFDASGLTADTVHTLSLEQNGRRLCADWPLKTFPSPQAQAKSFRFLSFTCAGGHEAQRGPDGLEVFRPMEFRRRLLARAMSYAPDAVIANGDHVYWDQRSGYDAVNKGWASGWINLYKNFQALDREVPMFGTNNEVAIKQLGDAQIRDLYGTLMRSVPTFFIGDDHDYFENDEANERYVTFPPDNFMVRAKQAVQRLYYPEMLPDATRTQQMSGVRNEDGLSENFGTLRYGDLMEVLLYDCGQYMDMKGAFGRIVPEEVEDWLIERTASNDTRHLMHVPSHPPGWSAGKWREWYPDIVESADAASPKAGSDEAQIVHFQSIGGKTRLSTSRPKFMWQKGWFAQHQRLMAAATGNRARPPVFLSGDLHAVGWQRIIQSGDIDMRANPVHTVLAGPIGSSVWAWPSKARGSGPVPPSALTVDAGLQPVEKNGFTIVDVEPDHMTFRFFGWKEPQALEEIDTLEPYETLRIERPKT